MFKTMFLKQNKKKQKKGKLPETLRDTSNPPGKFIKTKADNKNQQNHTHK